MSGSVEETTKPLTAAAIDARLATLSLEAAQAVLANTAPKGPTERPAGLQIATALTNAELARVVRLPNPARVFNDMFRTR